MNEKIWHVWHSDQLNGMEHYSIKADHFLLIGDKTVAFYKGADEEESVAIFTSVVNCTLEGVVVDGG